MKRTVLALSMVMVVFSVAAVVGGPEPGEGELAITSGGSSASGTTAVGPNGTAYSSNVGMTGTYPNISVGDSVENISYSSNETSFDGFIEAPTPCHVIDQETSKTGDSSYRLDIEAVKENESQQCVQQVVMIQYSATFQAETPYSLEVMHNNQNISTLQNGDVTGPDSVDDRKKSFFSGIMNWFGGLF